jgi:hypothetical protein
MTSKYLKFDNKFVGDVIDEKKKITIRRGSAFVNAGEDVDLLTGNGNKFGEAVIMWVSEEEAKTVVNRDFEHHVNYKGFEDFRKQMETYYDEEIKPSTEFSIIAFQIKNQ